LDLHHQAMTLFDQQVQSIGADRWTAPTPCAEWDVRALVRHLVYEQLWAVPLLAGATLDDVGDRFEGDILGADPVAAWTTAAAAARAAFTEPGVLDREVHTSIGRIPATEYTWQMTADLAVHGWDLATALGRPIELGDDLAGALVAWAEPELPNWVEYGIVAPPVPVPADADAQTKLIGLFGRQPRLD
jgi:uncharacterized protein (TIGR03086 family)